MLLQNLNLRQEHTHGYSTGGIETIAGHYHYDISPESVHYELFLVPATKLVRIDRC